MVDQPLPRITRIQPFSGLVIDQDTWATAHDYHRLHQQLHLLSLHGAGIARGLAVSPTDPPGDTVVVEPGVAVDDAGRVVIVPEAQRITLEARNGVIYIAVDYVESTPPVSGNGLESRGRVIEDFRIRSLTAPPEPPSLELARIEVVSSGDLVVAAPANRWAPGVNEIDSRFRQALTSRALTHISAGLVICESDQALDPAHLQGFFKLLRECGHSGLTVSPVVAPPGEVPDAELLYVTGPASAKPAKKLVSALAKQLMAGSWLIADACGPGDALSGGLSAALGDAEPEGAASAVEAMASEFVFGAPPPGASDGGDVRWHHHALVSERDYGCAWNGGRDGKPLARAQIRDALEFGVNVALCAAG